MTTTTAARGLLHDHPLDCDCPGWEWARPHAQGARGGWYPQCQSCGLAIGHQRAVSESYRYWHARTERWCRCAHPWEPLRVAVHQVWCASLRTHVALLRVTMEWGSGGEGIIAQIIRDWDDLSDSSEGCTDLYVRVPHQRRVGDRVIYSADDVVRDITAESSR